MICALLMTSSLVVKADQTRVEDTAVAKVSGECLVKIHKSIAMMASKTIRSWDDANMEIESGNLLYIGFMDRKSCLNSFDVIVRPTAVKSDKENNVTAISCEIQSIAEDSNAVDCG